MIITVTLNPAIDRTVEIEDFRLNTVNRISNSRDDAAGKGINVSKVIKVLEHESIAVAICAGNNGDFIKEHLDDNEIQHDMFQVSGETRINLKIVDNVNRTHTDINQRGPKVSEEQIEEIKEHILKYAQRDNIFVFSGSVTEGFRSDIYKELIKMVKDRGCKTILDADGKLFTEALESAPYLVKPNIHELENALEMRIDNKKDVINAVDVILNKGVEMVAVSLGHEGSMFISKDKVYWARGIEVEVKSTVGAGDSMVAALAVATKKGLDMKEAIRLGAAVSTANVMTYGTQTGKLDDIKNLLEKIEIDEIHIDEME